jgi:hypothetical protein
VEVEARRARAGARGPGARPQRRPSCPWRPTPVPRLTHNTPHPQNPQQPTPQALATYEAGLKADPGNTELKDGALRCVDAINRIAQGQGSEEELAESRAKAMEDPEIQGILRDPVMQQVLEDLQSDPRAAQRHMAHPEIRGKISKLIAAGIIRTA